MEKWLVSYRFPLKQIHWSIESKWIQCRTFLQWGDPPSSAPRNTWSCLLAWQMGARPRRPRTGFPDVILILIWLLFCGHNVVSSIGKILNYLKLTYPSWPIPVLSCSPCRLWKTIPCERSRAMRKSVKWKNSNSSCWMPKWRLSLSQGSRNELCSWTSYPRVKVMVKLTSECGKAMVSLGQWSRFMVGFPHTLTEEGSCEKKSDPKDLDEKERQLEEQQNRVQSLSNVLAKQQNVWN